ncbi:TPA: hypothetical protein JG895_004132 [Enterobacter hormaechei subsp. steigerwaltii]|uniref:hypothetical protein n=1 Tax=Enterobacter cloacae complex TaxID=354276 RepID=UPI0022EC4079|nr:hypothetical protein [Enterobacter hormaechei]HAV1699430.1 hypothetical protein [Enterobacter hormaechei subsp. steigerwaltii]EHF5009139.1 hypothetical protein [Enterobacter hormaechei]ELC6303378.1 hypothetical protein [Enterobacter hormaechei]WBT25834.1 hypothetical protein PF325_11615 [Enterobacter hormaechei]HDN2666676.1 hypothetical protein [Enterobacter hormaechei]
MQQYLESMRKAVTDENWFAALFLALAMPDICAKLETPDMANGEIGKFYKSWFNRYLRKIYAPENLYELYSVISPWELEPPQRTPGLPYIEMTKEQRTRQLKEFPVNFGPRFTAQDCWKMRCSCLHAGNLNGMKNKWYFTPPIPGIDIHMHSDEYGTQLQIDTFVNDVYRAVEEWLLDVDGDVKIQERISELLTIKKENLTPHVSITYSGL